MFQPVEDTLIKHSDFALPGKNKIKDFFSIIMNTAEMFMVQKIVLHLIWSSRTVE